MTTPLWSARADQPQGPGLTVAADTTDTGLRFSFASDSGHSVGLTFGRDEVYGLRQALDAHLAALADRSCPHGHYPVNRRDGRPPWCVYCGCTSDGTQVADVPRFLRGLS